MYNISNTPTTQSMKTRPGSRERELFLPLLLECSSLGTDSFPEGSVMLYSENASYALILGLLWLSASARLTGILVWFGLDFLLP